MTSPRTPRQLLGWTVADHVMSFDVAPNELTLWCFKHEPRVGSGRITRDPEHRPDQIIDFLKAHAHGETVEYRPNLDPDVAWPLSEVLPETPEPPPELGWTMYPNGGPDPFEPPTLKWRDDDDPVPASQSVPAVPVSSTGGKETGEATEDATETLGDAGREEQPDGIADDSLDLPDPARAAERVNAFLAWFGDGLVDEGDDTPLYARDLQALANLTARASEERAIPEPTEGQNHG